MSDLAAFAAALADRLEGREPSPVLDAWIEAELADLDRLTPGIRARIEGRIAALPAKPSAEQIVDVFIAELEA